MVFFITLTFVSFQLFGNEDLVGYEMSPSSMDLFADDKKGKFSFKYERFLRY